MQLQTLIIQNREYFEIYSQTLRRTLMTEWESYRDSTTIELMFENWIRFLISHNT